MTVARPASPPVARERIHQLDAIRGVLAIGVMVYHVVPGVPGGLGTYGVYAFFALSGFALEHVYRSRQDLNVRKFVMARIARLGPLWTAVLLVSAVAYGITDPGRVALNLSGLFGFVHPGATSIVTGGWSIGIEVVCYALFVLLARWKSSTRSLVALTIAALVVRTAYIAIVWTGGTLAEAWTSYTEAPTFLVFFLAGMVGARFAGRINSVWPFVIGCALVGGAMLSNQDRESLASPFLTAAATIGVALAGSGSAWRGRAAWIATQLGDMSYPTYLLHPLIAIYASPVALLTPVLALVVHRWYEVPAGRLIRRLRVRSDVPHELHQPDAVPASKSAS